MFFFSKQIIVLNLHIFKTKSYAFQNISLEILLKLILVRTNDFTRRVSLCTSLKRQEFTLASVLFLDFYYVNISTKSKTDSKFSRALMTKAQLVCACSKEKKIFFSIFMTST